jgi:HD-GYP domain-containing protein (c-di-GMP phosphodiesterase class II)
MIVENISVEVQTKFLYPGMILKGDAFDEGGELVLMRNEPVTEDLVRNLKARNMKTIRYNKERMKFKKFVSKQMVSEQSMTEAIGVLDTLEMQVKMDSHGIPEREITGVVDKFVNELRQNEDAFLNLMDLSELDDYTYTHSINVATISLLLGISLGLEESKLKDLGVAALLHDIGKLMVPREINEKNGKLTPEEWKVMKNHPVYGYNLIHGEKVFGSRVEQGVLLHHESYKGGGYPLGATSEKLDNIPQIITVADVFDALTTKRPYKHAWSINEAFSNLMEGSGIRFHPQITQVFLRDMVKKINEEALYPVGCYVLLNTGEVGFVAGHRLSPFTLRPIVNIFFNPTKGEHPTQQILRHIQQVDMEQDYYRFVVKKIQDPKFLEKFEAMLGNKAPARPDFAMPVEKAKA